MIEALSIAPSNRTLTIFFGPPPFLYFLQTTMATGEKKPPFSRKCDAWRRMVEMWEEGTIDKNTRPKDLYDMDDIFSNHEKRAVLAGFGKYKVEMGAHLCVNDDKCNREETC